MKGTKPALLSNPLKLVATITMLNYILVLLTWQQMTAMQVHVQALSLDPNASPQTRRNVLLNSGLAIPSAIGSIAALTSSPEAASSSSSSSLATKLSKRDAASLSNSIFNIPPSGQTYPKFMHGSWDMNLAFQGYLFPSQTISKDKIISNVNIPGFQKCSIASIADVGRDSTSYTMDISPSTGLEDRRKTLTQSTSAHLGGYDAVKDVLYDVTSNPNRISIEFVKNRTRNAERIELFCNARESELVPAPNGGKDDDGEPLSIFVNSEYIRQVTFSLSQEFGVARQVVGNYAHFWTWRQQPGGTTMTGNVLTACYLDPQDAMFFQEPSKPVAVYSHNIRATRKIG